MRFIDSDFDGWWRDVGQFIPPCDSLNDADRQVFKSFARAIKKSCGDKSEELEEAEQHSEQLEDRVANLELQIKNRDEKEAAIEAAVPAILEDDTLSSFDKITKLKKLYEDKS